MAQLVERSAVNRQVLGSIPSGGAFFLLVYTRGVTYCLLLQTNRTVPGWCSW